MEEKQFNFEEFTKRGRPAVLMPLLSIQARGTFTLNAPARELLPTTDERIYVALGYDRQHEAVSIRLVPEEHPNAYPMNKQKDDNTWIIGGAAFCKHNGIPIGQVRRYQVRVLEPGTLVFELTQWYPSAGKK